MMNPSPGRAAALLISLFLVVVSCVAADTGGYTMAPAAAGTVTGSPQDPVSITFWELNFREMLIAVCLSFFPVVVQPVEIFFLLKLWAVLGYRKVVHNAIRYNRNRQNIEDCITKNPGVKFNELERMTGINGGTLKYHLLILGAKQRIISFGTGRSVRYFENNGRYSEVEKKVLLHLRDPTTRKILEILVASPEVTRKDIAGIVGIAGPSISWHTKRLSGDGIISLSRNGRGVRYTLCPAGVSIFKKYFGKEGGKAKSAEDARSV